MSEHARDHADRHGLGGPDELDVRSLASGTASSATFLRGDRTWAAASGGGVTDHGALTGLGDDDHTQYQLRSEKASASGYASLDASTKVPIAQIPTGATSSTVCIGNDSRLSDSRTPTAHKTSHATGGTDALTAADIGAATSSALTSHTGATGTAVHGLGTASTKDVPATGDATTSQVVYGTDTRLTNSRTPTAHASTHASAGSDPITPTAIGAASSSDLTTHTGATGTAVHGLGTASTKNVPATGNASATEVVYGTDTRLTDSRTPTAHKSSHATGGSDALAPSDIGAIATSAIGSTVQGYDADLQTIGGLTPANDDFLQRKTGAWTNRTIAQVKTDLGVKAPTVQVLTSTTSATYTTPSGCTTIIVEMVGAGGGGGGVSGALSQAAGAGGGAAGGYLRELIASPSATYTYQCGTRGTGGTAGNNNGTAGTATTFSTLSASGGGGGTGMAAGTAIAIARGGLDTTGSSGGDINGYGADGQTGVRYSASVNFAGAGGSSVFGGGGRSQDGNGAGNAAVTLGSGGAGACSSNNATSRAGGNGAHGVIVVTEFYG